MSIPENRKSTTPEPADFLWTVQRLDPMVDSEMGGVALNDPSLGLLYQWWNIEYDRDSGTVALRSETGQYEVLFARTGISELSFTFDQNMAPVVSFVSGGVAELYWYDPVVGGFVFVTSIFPSGAKNPRCKLDDHRTTEAGASDVILMYLVGTTVFKAEQRDRFTVSTAIDTGFQRLHQIGMNRKYRFQWAGKAQSNTGSPVFCAEIVRGELLKSGVRDEQINTDELWFPVDGYRIATQGGADSKLSPLMPAYFFDVSVYDGKFHFPLRANSPVSFEISTEELIERDNAPPVSITRVQEAELLRKITLSYIDNSIDYATNTQTGERRSQTVEAKGEQSVELPISFNPDEASTVVMRRLGVAWGEPQRFELTLPSRLSAKAVPGAVMRLRDRRGKVYMMRVMRAEYDNGPLMCECEEHAPWVYTLQSKGVWLEGPSSTTPGLVGDTVVVPMNLPAMNDGEDELGIHLAVYGTGSGWYGGEVQMSTDGGASVHQSFQTTGAANYGELLEPLLAEADRDYPGTQTLLVKMRYQLDSLSRADTLRYNNLIAIENDNGKWELLQYSTAEQIDDETYRLHRVIRGRFDTPTDSAAVGRRVIQIDSSIVFVRLQQWMLGQELSYRGISYKQDSDDAEWHNITLTSLESQREWSVHRVRAERDGSNNVTVSWIGRARLGVETNPYHSKYFGGYRVIYSDGYTADTTAMTHTRAGAPAGVTVKIAPINTISGLGPESEGVPT